MSFPSVGSYVGPSRASRRMSWFLLFLVGVALTVTLYFVKTHAQSAKRDVRVLSQAIAAEDAAIRVLRAELAYLENPMRLSDLNQTHLKLTPIRPDQEHTSAKIEQMFPLVEAQVSGGGE